MARLLALTIAVVLAAGPAAAQAPASGHDSTLPIEIIADTMEWQQEERIAIARGNADAVQGEYRLHADQLTAYLHRDGGGDDEGLGEISRIDADGNVFLSTPTETAQGLTGVYDVVAGVIVLVGDVVLTRAENVIRGERLVHDLNTGKSRVDSAATVAGEGEAQRGPDGRVRALFLPQSRDQEQ